MPYGLSEKDYSEIVGVFKPYQTKIEKVILFGSRARGDFKETSDIDLSVIFKAGTDRNILFELLDQLEMASVIYTIDLIDFHGISNVNLKNDILREGKTIF